MSFDPKQIRNVVLLGHSHSGKTSLIESMLFEAKAITRRGTIDAGNTVSDFSEIEQERKASLYSKLMHVSWKDSKINIIDTPGSDDFVGEILSSMKVADLGIMTINAAHGVEVGTELLWEYVEKFNLPAMFVINQCDHEKADFDATLDQAISRFGHKLIPFQYPLNPGKNFNAIIDALRMIMYEFPADGGKPIKKEIPASEMQKAQSMHNAIVEAAAENDDTLMEHFFETGNLDESELADGLRKGIAKQSLFPVFCSSAIKNMGSGRIMGFINDVCPSPADRPAAKLKTGELFINANGPATLFVYKTMTEPKVGRVSYFKVYSGKIKTGDEFINNSNRGSERLNQIFVSNGKNREAVNELVAGDLGVVVKLKDTHTNNTLSIKGNDIEIEPIPFPEPRIRAAISTDNKNDFEKLIKSIHDLQEEDPTLVLEHSQRLKQNIIHGQGQLHLDLLKYRIEKLHGLHVDFLKPKIPYLETITKASDTSYRHKKQSGGSGQFGEVHMRVEPFHEGMPDPAGLNVRHREAEELSWGGKLSFFWCIVGGAIDTKFSSAIKKGIMNKMVEGPLTGSYCTDIRVSVFDGKMHAVDSNDMAFQIAGTMAFKEAFHSSGAQILEPVYELVILCQDEAMGDIMGDLQTRRAIILGMDSEGHYKKIKAKVPLSEMHNYSSSLRSMTQGKAKFSMHFNEYAPVTPDIQQKLIAEYKAATKDMEE
ncbi:MAG: elongation factor G [Saprospiraceae bacterium]|nr:elongation factor G [Saprospiraceae bacterium]MBK8485119.1 elongation factor G [Saprospiraceae bacterium]MBK9223079.1 elongation factor G [Saprospiraceae bacterium]MBK9720609.1 elongation factor G [Saprospiraceae bacterium]MBK9727598.1 elongation factor G [Saprospiraceae bacterium]